MSLMRPSARSSSRSFPLAKQRTPSALAYSASTGIASRTCSTASPSMTVPSRVSSVHDPWPGMMVKLAPPSCAIPASIEASVRNDGFMKRSPTVLLRSEPL